SRLFYVKQKVGEYYAKGLVKLGNPIAKFEAGWGIGRMLHLAEGAKPVLARNHWQEVDLINGIRGVVKVVVYV
ncbi:unnamed protein product, partial [Discosporangium mesarthrocarpum]